MNFWLILHVSPKQFFLTSEILRIYNWPLIWSCHAEHTRRASMVNLVHCRHMVSPEETGGKSSQGAPALHAVLDPLKPVDFARSVGTPCHRGSSKGRVGRWKEYSTGTSAKCFKINDPGIQQVDSWLQQTSLVLTAFPHAPHFLTSTYLYQNN